MNSLSFPQASVCDPAGNCVHVYGDTARVINWIAVGVAMIIAVIVVGRLAQ